MNIQLVTNASAESGVGHYAAALAEQLQKHEDVALARWQIDGAMGTLARNNEQQVAIHSWQGMLGSKSVNWIRLGNKLQKQNAIDPTLWHFTNQTLSFLTKKLQPSVVTVHDLIELLEPQDKKAYWLNRYLYSGIVGAEQLICVSEYTKRAVQERFNIPNDKITVIHNGVGSEFHPIPQFETTIAYQSLLHELSLTPETKVVLYVGSDHPRKNVIAAVQAFAATQGKLPVPTVFLKVGSAGVPAGREALLIENEELGIRDSVRFIEGVALDRLNELYNLADVLVFPSRHEGFGLPPLQAMAAGTPVIVANTTSLPEVVGEAGLMHEPDDVALLTSHLTRVLTDQNLADDLARKGQQQAQRFSWISAAQATIEVYTKALAV